MSRDLVPKRQTDEEYLEYLRGGGCDVCTRRGEPHHLDTRGSGGSDYTCVLLCRKHHTEIGQIGMNAFQEKYNINCYKTALRHLRHYLADGPIIK